MRERNVLQIPEISGKTRYQSISGIFPIFPTFFDILYQILDTIRLQKHAHCNAYYEMRPRPSMKTSRYL